MTTSQTHILSEVLSDDPISDGTFAYFQERLQNELHDVILSEFARLEEAKKMTRAALARRMGCRPEQITHWLGIGGNWTVGTISRFVTAMRGQLRIEFLPLRAALSAELPEMALSELAPTSNAGQGGRFRVIQGGMSGTGEQPPAGIPSLSQTIHYASPESELAMWTKFAADTRQDPLTAPAPSKRTSEQAA